MNSLNDVIKRFRRMPFYKNAMLTMIVGFRLSLPRVLAILIQNDKNAKRRFFTSKSSYINYLED